MRSKEWLKEYLNDEVIVEINKVRLNFTLINKVLIEKKVPHRRKNLYFTFLNSLR